MKLLVLLKKDGKGNIYDENGAEATDIVDEKPDSYLEENAQIPTNDKNIEQSKKEIGRTMKISTNAQASLWHMISTKELPFQYKAHYLILVRTAVLKAGVKQSTARI
ncbi:hypothetical protein G6F62_006345 [Rhizopus arrhizus]|nr:hypothetical protein G6F33_003794 [Rhizopus arrhizus]KAG1336173.1 hypothetical protein G6F62_006345 [Rhizopus arrhizus]